MISIVITTYGDPAWRELAWSRAYPSAIEQEASELSLQVVVHHSELATIGPARNEAAQEATGEWLIFLDADDELEPGYVQAMLYAAASHGGQVLFQPAVRYLRKGGGMTRPLVIPARNLRQDNFLVIGTMLRRQQFHEVGGFNDYHHGFEDWSLWAKCWLAGASVVPVPQAVYRAHHNPQSKHRQLWRDRRAQVEMHTRVARELFGEGAR